MAEITLEQIQAALKATNTEVNIKDLAKIAKALQNGEITNTEKQSKTTGITWTVEMEKYPDFAIRRKTAKTSQLLVIMPSCEGYYIKYNAGGNEVVDELTEDNYCKFTASMPEITLSDEMWIKTICGGKRFFYLFNQAIRSKTYCEMIRNKCATNYEKLYYNWSKKLNDESIKNYEAYPTLYRRYHNNELISNRILSDITFTKLMIDKFGLNNVYDFCESQERSLITQGSRYGNYSIYNTHNLIDLLKDYEFHYAEFKDYVLYSSVRMGYARNTDLFFQDWKDSLRIQMSLYGKIKEKYPTDLPLLHQQLSYKAIIYQDIIDEQGFEKNRERLSKYNMKVKDFIFRCPENKQDMIDEATQQANCLAGYTSRFASGECEIFFMRQAKTPDESYITIETKDGDIRQIYYANNRAVSQTDRDIAELWMKRRAKIDKGEELKDEEKICVSSTKN